MRFFVKKVIGDGNKHFCDLSRFKWPSSPDRPVPHVYTTVSVLSLSTLLLFSVEDCAIEEGEKMVANVTM